ncbi:ABC transporter ATP-binding protein [Arthrobacter sp. MI7-26]|uniref:ABC transporter ATP-binding protein n=1 Tax=Arthrobacter sp. MI7-26 TaxID=2993653 RepID=UPI0022497D65|nr:ABC transporter ATP-binding protein [Arthrobacter sp. MI7-26]MCX2750060.1 ABC transporter ATP-binding protein [Arthrobacter sp. MI7-26]
MSRLELSDLHVRYGAVAALRGVDLVVESGTILALIGPNGAGKSTTLLAMAGACEGKVSGRIVFNGNDISLHSPEKRTRAGIALVPEGRRIFTKLSVEQNLTVARAGRADRAEVEVEEIYERFPVLGDFASRQAGLLSGGQQQQLAIGRALMMRPTVLLLDEPSLGLSPKIVEEVFQTVVTLRDEGMTIVLVEQNAKRAAELADVTYVMRHGKLEGKGATAVTEELAQAFFSARGDERTSS